METALEAGPETRNHTGVERGGVMLRYKELFCRKKTHLCEWMKLPRRGF